MPYTFGGSTGNDVSLTVDASIASNTCLFVYGWWLPTTLTAGRRLWGLNFSHVGIDTTTSELTITIDHGTDSVYTTTGVGLTVDQWSFIAFFGTFANGSATEAIKIWSGTLTTPPTAVTVTNTVAAIGGASGLTTFTIGNRGAATTEAWQGDIAEVGYISTTQSGDGTTHPFMIATTGTVSAAEEQLILEKFVLPAWLGNHWNGTGYNTFVGNFTDRWYMNLNVDGIAVGGGMDEGASLGPRGLALNATVSQNGPPRPHPGMTMLPYVRR